MQDIYGDHSHCPGDNPQVDMQLLILEGFLPFPQTDQEIQVEVHPEQNHKYRDHAVNISTVVVCHTGIHIGEASGSRRTERMEESVIKIHPSEQQQHHFHGRQYKIHGIQDLSRSPGTGYQLVRLRPGYLRAHQMHGVFIVQGCQHHDKYQHPHSADPVRQAPPEGHPPWQGLNVRQDRRPGGRKTGYGLEKSIQIAGDTARKEERERPEQRPQNPGRAYNEQPFFFIDPPVSRLFSARQQKNQKKDPADHHKMQRAFFFIKQCHESRDQKKHALYPQHLTYDKHCHPIIHVRTYNKISSIS